MLVPDPALRGDDNTTGTPFSKRGKHTKMDEVGLFMIENGKITREEFFDPTGP